MLDTHALVWLIEGDERVGDRTRRRIDEERAEGGILIPAMSVWEIALLASRNKVGISLDPQAWITIVLALPGFSIAPLEPEIAIRTALLDWPHRDPADRMIVATAIEHDAPLVTVDRAILAYAAAGHVKAIDARL